MHTVEIDDEVYEYLRRKAEPFVDKSPNDVMRRELLGGRPGRKAAFAGSDRAGNRPALGDAPLALLQVLDVVELARRDRVSRTDATKMVARDRDIAWQTVQDKYGRQLGLSTAEFDVLLCESDLASLRALLCRRFPRHTEVIERQLGGLP
jgi:hypothetical protein